MFGWYYPDAEAVLADPNGRVIVTDGRNHLELTNERYDIIVTDPPPPIESSGRRRSSRRPSTTRRAGRTSPMAGS